MIKYSWRKVVLDRLVRRHLPLVLISIFLLAEVVVFPFWKFAFSLPKLILFLFVGGCFYLTAPSLGKMQSLSSSSLIFCLFLLGAFISGIQGVSFPLSFYGSVARLDGWVSWCTMFLIYLFFQSYGYLFEKHLPLFVGLLAGLSSLYAILQKIGLDPFIWDRWDPRAGSFYGYSAGLAAILLLLFPYLLLWKRRGSALLIALLGVALFFTANRAAFLGVAIEVSLFIFFQGGKWKRIIPIFFLLFGLIFMVGSGRQWLDTSVGQRIEIWSKTLTLNRKAPWLGYGGGTFELSFQKLKDEKMLLRDGDTVLADKPHNFFLEIIYSDGLVGLFLFSAFLFLIAFQSYGSFLKKKDPFFLSLLGYLFFLSFHFVRVSDGFLFMLLAGVASMKKPGMMPAEHNRAFRGSMAFVAIVLFTLTFLFYRVGSLYQQAVSLKERGKIRASLLALGQAAGLLPFLPDILEARALEESYVKVYAPLPFTLRWEDLYLASGVYPHRRIFFWISKAYEKSYEETHEIPFLKKAVVFAQRTVLYSPWFAEGRIQLAKLKVLLYKRSGEESLLREAQDSLELSLPAPFQKAQKELRKVITDEINKK